MAFKRESLLVMGLCIFILSAEPLLRNGGAANNARIAFVSTRGENTDIYVMDSDGKHRQRVTTHDAEDIQPTWSPDGRKIAFVSNRNQGFIQIWVIDADGRNPIRLTDGVWDEHPDWSPDGQKIAYQASRKKALNIENGTMKYTLWAPTEATRDLSQITRHMTANRVGRPTVKKSPFRPIEKRILWRFM